MLYIIIGVIIGVLFYRWLHCVYDNIPETVLTIILSICVSFMTWLILGLTLGSIFYYALPYEQSITKVELCAMNDNSDLIGQTFLFSGYINEKNVIKYIENTDKGKHINMSDSDISYIIEENVDIPYLEILSRDIENGYLNLWLVTDWEEKEYIYHVPYGTVTSNYNIDLQLRRKLINE